MVKVATELDGLEADLVTQHKRTPIHQSWQTHMPPLRMEQVHAAPKEGVGQEDFRLQTSRLNEPNTVLVGM